MLAVLVVIAIGWSVWAARRLWINSAIKRRRARRRVQRQGVRAFVV